MKSNLN